MSLHTRVEIKKQCRETHGVDGAFEEAVKFLREQYKFYVKTFPKKTIEIKMEVKEKK